MRRRLPPPPDPGDLPRPPVEDLLPDPERWLEPAEIGAHSFVAACPACDRDCMEVPRPRTAQCGGRLAFAAWCRWRRARLAWLDEHLEGGRRDPAARDVWPYVNRPDLGWTP